MNASVTAVRVAGRIQRGRVSTEIIPCGENMRDEGPISPYFAL